MNLNHPTPGRPGAQRVVMHQEAAYPAATDPSPVRAWLQMAFIGLAGLALAACEPQGPPADNDVVQFRYSGSVETSELDEISGLQASRRQPGVLWTHNDDGPARVFAMGTDGSDLGYFDINDAVNVDWEDMTLIPGTDRDLLVLADIGDNDARRARVWLYFVEEPQLPGSARLSGTRDYYHWLALTYPDGPRDAESISWDPINEELLLLSKRDRPFRLYSVDLRTALNSNEVELSFKGEIDSLRPPMLADRQTFGKRTPWISQPTGLDIAPDGSWAAIISYRSLYLYPRLDRTDWHEVLSSDEVIEIVGPRGPSEEAISFGRSAEQLWIGSEGVAADVVEFKVDTQRALPSPAAVAGEQP